MVSPEFRTPDHTGSELPSKIDADIDAAIELKGKSTDYLKDKIGEQHKGSTLVANALEEVDHFYDDNFFSYQDMDKPLLLAVALPSEKNVPESVTAIRLIHQIGQLENFRIGEYGAEVERGVRELTQAPQESLAKYFKRLHEADQQRPDLQLVTTQAKQMLHTVLQPVGIPLSSQPPIMKVRYRAKFSTYEAALPSLFGNNINAPWHRRITKGLERGKEAVGILG